MSKTRGSKSDKNLFFDFRTRTALRSHQANKKSSVMYTLRSFLVSQEYAVSFLGISLEFTIQKQR